MTTTDVQIWVGIIGSLVAVAVSVLGVLDFQRRRDRSAAVGSAFKDVVESLASDNPTRRMAGAILMRRFFDVRSEQGAARTPYARESVAVITGLLRKAETGPIQKVLADGLRYAPSLAHADLQGCNLAGAYLGRKKGDRRVVDLTEADLFEADLTGASLKEVNARGAVFYGAIAVKTVFTNADLTGADFRSARLEGAKFEGAHLDRAQFGNASDIPLDVEERLDSRGRVATQPSAR
jgi:hypothetical protein